MKRLFFLALMPGLILLYSCSKDYDEPQSSNDVAKNDQVVLVANSAWFDEYERLVLEENTFIDLIASGALSEEELASMETQFLEGQVTMQDFIPHLNDEQYQSLQMYEEELTHHFENVEFEDHMLDKFEKIHLKGMEKWKDSMPVGHPILQKADECEEEAAAAAVAVLTGGIGAGLGGALFSGGLSIPAGVVGGIFGSIGTWAVMVSRC
jgi:hypothetical protein